MLAGIGTRSKFGDAFAFHIRQYRLVVRHAPPLFAEPTAVTSDSITINARRAAGLPFLPFNQPTMSYPNSNPYPGQFTNPSESYSHSTPSTPLDAYSPWEVIDQQHLPEFDPSFQIPIPQQHYQQQQHQQETYDPTLPTIQLEAPERTVPSQARPTRRRSTRLNTIPEGSTALSPGDVKPPTRPSTAASGSSSSMLLRHEHESPRVRAHPYRRPQSAAGGVRQPRRRGNTAEVDQNPPFAQMGEVSGSGSSAPMAPPMITSSSFVPSAYSLGPSKYV